MDKKKSKTKVDRRPLHEFVIVYTYPESDKLYFLRHFKAHDKTEARKKLVSAKRDIGSGFSVILKLLYVLPMGELIVNKR